MRRSLIWVLAAVVSGTSCGGGDGSGGGIGLTDRNGDGDIRILAFGDSITRGRGDGPSSSTTGGGYPARLQEMLGVPVVNAGVPGERIQSGSRRFPQELARHNPDYAIVLEGIIDLETGDRQRVLDNLQAMINAAVAAGVIPVIGTFPPTCCSHRNAPPRAQILRTNEILAQMSREQGFALLDFHRAFVPNPAIPYDESSGLLHQPDGLHPTPAGYDAMAVAAANLF